MAAVDPAVTVMFRNYTQILRLPGTFAFTCAGVLARSPQAMAGIAAVMLMAQERNSYSVAGFAASVYVLAGAVVGPQIFRFIDAFGQRRIVPLQLAVHVPAFVGVLIATLATDANWPIYLLAAISGASQPDAGTLVRARWAALLHDDPLLRTAFAWESQLDDVVFVLGPLIGTFVAVTLSPGAALLLSMTLLIVGSLSLVAQRSTEPPPAGTRIATSGRPAILLPGVGAMCGIFFLLGGVFGAFDVTTVAFADSAGVPELAGVLLALYAAGSLLAGAVFGATTLKSAPTVQFVLAAIALALLSLPLSLLAVVSLMAVGLFVAGAARAPVMISATTVIERVVPATRLSETLAWSMSGLAIGIAVATPLAGLIVDRFGAAMAYWVPAGFAVSAALAAAAAFSSLRRAETVAAVEPATTASAG